MKRKILSLLLALVMVLTVLPVLPVFAASYDLYIYGVQVTDANKDDILGNGAFAYDPASQTLTVKGDYYCTGSIISNYIDGLTITSDGYHELQSENGNVLYSQSANVWFIDADLTLKASSCCIYFIASTDYYALFICDSYLELEGDYGITGNNTQEEVFIDNSELWINANVAAISDIGLKLEFRDCEVVSGGTQVGNALMDGSDYALSVHIAPISTAYELYIEGTQVTDANKSDVLGNGVFAYDPASTTLTIKDDYYCVPSMIENYIDGLVVATDGKCELQSEDGNVFYSQDANVQFQNVELTLKADYICIYFAADAAACGLYIDGSYLELEGDYGITGDDTYEEVHLNSSELWINANVAAINDIGQKLELNGCAVVSGGVQDGNTIMDGGDYALNIHIAPDSTDYDLFICNQQVKASNKDDVLGDGAFRYDPTAKELHVLKDCYYADTVIENEIPGLKITYENGVELLSSSGSAISTNCDLTIDGKGKTLSLSASGCGINNWDGTATVTIKDAKLNVTGNYGITGDSSSAQKLVINNCEILATGTTEAISDFKNGIELIGCKIDSPIGGSIKNGSIVDSAGDKAKTVVIVPSGAAYDIEICGVQVDDSNKGDVLGDGKFVYDDATNTLTVKGETSYDGQVIVADVEDLTIVADGDVTLKTTSANGYDCVLALDTATLTSPSGSFRLEATDPSVDVIHLGYSSSNLLIDNAKVYARGFRPILGNGGKLMIKSSDVEAIATNDGYAVLGFDDGIKLANSVVVTPADYDIFNGGIWDNDAAYYAAEVKIERSGSSTNYPLWIAGVAVDDLNCDDILGDGLFEYVPRTKTLYVRGDCDIAEGYVIRSVITGLTIVVEDDSELTVSNSAAALQLSADTTITSKSGTERLICQTNNGCGICVDNYKTLTIEDACVGGAGYTGGITGAEGSKIVINCSAVAAMCGSSSGAALSAEGGLTINDCTLAKPVGGSWDTNRVYDALGNVATDVELAPDRTDYDLAIDGVRVTSANCKDVLKNGRFEYDEAANTLYVKGSYSCDDVMIANMIPDLTIETTKPSFLMSESAPVIATNESITLTSANGDTWLELESDNEAALYIDTTDAKTVTLEYLTLYCVGEFGIRGENEQEKLVIDSAFVWCGASDTAISGFGGGIELKEDRIVRPCDAKIIDGEICNRDGDPAGIVEIRRDLLGAGNTWRVMFVTDHGETPADQVGKDNMPITKPADPKEDGWRFLGWYTTDTYETAWDFSQPGGNITLYAKWEPAPAELVNPFVDVIKGKYYYDAVLWAFYATPQITNGVDATHFKPDNTCTRGQIVTFLWRAKGCPEPSSLTSPFEDVQDSSKFYYKAVLWAVEKGITNGIDATHFKPDNGCNRGQVVTFLWRADGKPDPAKTDNPFVDVQDSSKFYYTAVLWAFHSTPQITNGIDATHFKPDNTCTRGQIVTFLKRDIAP